MNPTQSFKTSLEHLVDITDSRYVRFIGLTWYCHTSVITIMCKNNSAPLVHAHMFTITHVFTMWDDVSRERTWAIEEWHHVRKRVWAKTSDAAFQLSLPVIHIYLAPPPPRSLSCWFFWGFLTAAPEESYQSTYDFTVLSLPVSIHPRDRRWQLTIGRGPQKIFYQAHSFILAYRWRNSETHKDAQKHRTESVSPPSRVHRRTHLPFHPKETVHIQTNRGDGYCPNAIILYCPSPWLLWDKGPSVDEACSVWIGG